MNFAEIVPVSALRGANLDHLRDTIESICHINHCIHWIKLPIVLSVLHEIIREKIMRQLGEEISL